MGFECDGNTIFNGLELLYTIDDGLLATITAGSEWDNETTAAINITWAGDSVSKDIELCDYIDEDAGVACGQKGDVVLNLTSKVSGLSSTLVEGVMVNATIEVTAQPDGSTEEYESCNKAAFETPYRSPSMMGRASKTAGFLFGAIALVGLAAYAVKRRNRATSENGADEQLYRGEVSGEMA